MNKILIIAGPTASGKTALAVKCAKLLDSEVISADSMQVYENLNIGTAKPTQQETEGVTHRMIDVFSPFFNATVSDYSSLAKEYISALFKRGKVPVICGGTGFYINSLLYNLSYGRVKEDLKIRKKYLRLYEEKGGQYLHDILKKTDPASADKIHCNDVKRVIRALEIYESSGIRKSDISDDKTSLYDYSAFCIDWPREVLYERIEKRVDKMFSDGLLDEVKSLVDSGLDLSYNSMQGIGYKECFAYIKSQSKDLDALKEQIKKATRNYAKRQITFFKKLDGLIYMKGGEDLKKTAENVIKLSGLENNTKEVN